MKTAAVAAATDSQGGGGEYNLNSSGNSSGQEWILDAYRSLEPGVSFFTTYCISNFCVMGDAPIEESVPMEAIFLISLSLSFMFIYL